MCVCVCGITHTCSLSFFLSLTLRTPHSALHTHTHTQTHTHTTHIHARLRTLTFWPDLFLISKIWCSTIYAGPEAIKAQVEKQLVDLQTDYIDGALLTEGA